MHTQSGRGAFEQTIRAVALLPQHGRARHQSRPRAGRRVRATAAGATASLNGGPPLLPPRRRRPRPRQRAQRPQHACCCSNLTCWTTCGQGLSGRAAGDGRRVGAHRPNAAARGRVGDRSRDDVATEPAHARWRHSPPSGPWQASSRTAGPRLPAGCSASTPRRDAATRDLALVVQRRPARPLQPPGVARHTAAVEPAAPVRMGAGFGPVQPTRLTGRASTCQRLLDSQRHPRGR